MDFNENKRLKKANVVKIAFREYKKGVKYSDLAIRWAETFYEAFLTDGDTKYSRMINDPKNRDGASRHKQIRADLRNHLEHHVYSLHKFGPAMVEQGQMQFEKDDSVKKGDEENFSDLVMNLKYGKVGPLRHLYTRITNPKKDAVDKDGNPLKKHDWIPVTKVAIEPDKPEDGPDISYRLAPSAVESTRGHWLVVEGGATEEFRQALLDNMEFKIVPENEPVEPKAPTATERKPIVEASTSGSTKSTALWFDRGYKGETEGLYLKAKKTRSQWNEHSLSNEAREAALLKLEAKGGLEPMIQELIKALTMTTSAVVDAERTVTAIVTINEALKPKAKAKAKAKG